MTATEAGRSTRRWRAWRVGLFVTLAAPLIASILVYALLLINGLVTESPPTTILVPSQTYDLPQTPNVFVTLFAILTMLVAFGYVFGIVPAALSGAWLGVRTLRSGGFSYGEAILTAASVTLVYGFAIAVRRPELDDILGSLFASMLLMVLTVPSALIVRWLLGRLGWLERPDA